MTTTATNECAKWKTFKPADFKHWFRWYFHRTDAKRTRSTISAITENFGKDMQEKHGVCAFVRIQQWAPHARNYEERMKKKKIKQINSVTKHEAQKIYICSLFRFIGLEYVCVDRVCTINFQTVINSEYLFLFAECFGVPPTKTNACVTSIFISLFGLFLFFFFKLMLLLPPPSSPPSSSLWIWSISVRYFSCQNELLSFILYPLISWQSMEIRFDQWMDLLPHFYAAAAAAVTAKICAPNIWFKNLRSEAIQVTHINGDMSFFLSSTSLRSLREMSFTFSFISIRFITFNFSFYSFAFCVQSVNFYFWLSSFSSS